VIEHPLFTSRRVLTESVGKAGGRKYYNN